MPDRPNHGPFGEKQADTPAARALLDQIAEPLRIAVRADDVVRGPAEHPSGVPGITVRITV